MKAGDHFRCDNWGHVMFNQPGTVVEILEDGVRVFWPIHSKQLPNGMIYKTDDFADLDPIPLDDV